MITKAEPDCHYNDLIVPSSQNIFSKLAIVKLNGGLGTTMHCDSTKSLIPFFGEHRCIDFTIQELEKIEHKL